MTTRILILAVLLALSARETAAQAATPLPRIVERGFELLARDSADAAIKFWTTAWDHEADAGKTEQLLTMLQPISEYAGSIRGVDVVATRPLSPNYIRIFAIVRYERMPVFIEIRPYNSGGATEDWRMATITLNTDPTKVFPPDIWPR